jgi:predicted ATPase/class 3 adenylate cyclase
MRCSSCGSDNPDGARFCDECAAPMPTRCPGCGATNRAGAKFCNACASPLAAPAAHSSERVTPAVSIEPSRASEGERKTVTALFADLKGSTEMIEHLDPEEARALVDPALRIMVEAVRRYEGYVVQSTGDGVFALFGAPAAYEDHPQRALYAALQMQQDLREYSRRLADQNKPALEARVGVNTGEVVVRTVETGGKVEYTPIGLTANLAARWQTVAPPGSVAISEHTRRLVEGYFDLRSLGPTPVKGVSDPVGVFEVIGPGPLRTHFQLSARRGLTHFVGREGELEQIKRALELAVAGHGQLVAVVAEAGAGKSRLVHEFKAVIPPGCKVLEAYSVSHGKASAWLPVLDLLRGYFDIRDADDAEARRDKARTALNALDPALCDALPYLFGLLGIQDAPDPLAQMDPQIRRRRTLDAIRRVFIRESLDQPLVLIFEDLHWIDGETQALLDLLADSVANVRVLLLVNYRPEYRHEWGNKSYYSQLRLRALERDDSSAMLSALLGDGVELNPVKRLIIERAEGNPFFIEEMTQALFDEGALVRNGGVKVARSLSQIRLPTTVQGILAARIDRLPAEQKELLQTLAVIGRESSLGLIRRMADVAEPQLEQMLTALQAGEFVYEQPAFPDPEYVFKHALTHEVAYGSLLIERRKVLHERVGQAIESLFENRLEDHLTELARHYSGSDNISKATEYLERAGQQALRRAAYTNALSSFNAAIQLLDRLVDNAERIRRELRLQIAIAPVLIMVEGWAAPEVERAYARARELCERVGDGSKLFPTLLGTWIVHLIRGELEKAYLVAEQLLWRAQSTRDPVRLMYAHHTVGTALFWMGESHSARENFETALSFYDPERHASLAYRHGGIDPRISDLLYVVLILWRLGYPDQSLEKMNQTLALAEDLSHTHCLVYTEFFFGLLRQLRREAYAAQERADRIIGLSAEHGLTGYLAFGTILRGWAIVEQGCKEEGIAQMQEGLAASRTIGDEWRRYFLRSLAEARGQMGCFDEGLSALTEVLSAVDKYEDRHHEAEVYRIKGELLLGRNGFSTEEAQNCFARAIEIAQKQSAKSWELRATTSLARLLASQGRRSEAREMLAEIYNWFTEGFDTADLKDAKALLDQLGG